MGTLHFPPGHEGAKAKVAALMPLDRPESQEGGERRNNITFDIGVDHLQRFEDRFILHTRRPLAKRYIEGGLYIHAHFACWIEGRDQTEPSYWCVGIYRPVKGFDSPGTNNEVRFLGIDAEPGEARDCRMQQAVLVDAVQVVENPQGMSSVVVPSVVRLQTLYDCLRIWVPSLDLGKSTPRSGPSILLDGVEPTTAQSRFPLPVFISDDREFGALGDLVRQGGGVRQGEGKGESVESRAEVVQGVTDEEAERIRGWFLGGSEEHPVPIFRINLMPDRVVIAIDPVFDAFVQLLQVVERTTDLQFMVERRR